MRAHCQHCVKQCKTSQLCTQKTIEKSMVSWNKFHVDLIGPLSVHAKNSKFGLNALTMIDPSRGWLQARTAQLKPLQQPLLTDGWADALDLNWLDLMEAGKQKVFSEKHSSRTMGWFLAWNQPQLMTLRPIQLFRGFIKSWTMACQECRNQRKEKC